MEANKSRLIVVLGMHRSGTSALTRGLKVMGVKLGDKLIPPSEGINPKGFWEDIDLNALNIEMLAAINSDWNHVSALKQHQVEELRRQGFLLRAAQLLQEKLNNTSIFGFKDPRVAKLLPFWKEVFDHGGYKVSYVIALRNPLSIAQSLEKRDGIDAIQSYFLWLGHVLTSLSGSFGAKRILVDYDLLMLSPEQQLNRVAHKLGLNIDPAELQFYKMKFLDPGLRHTAYELNELFLDNSCPPVVRDIYASLLDVATDRIDIDNPNFARQVSIWEKEFDRLSISLKLIDHLFTEKTKLKRTIAECDVQIATLNQFVSERDVQIATLNQLVSERDVQIATLNQFVSERDVQNTSLRQAVHERDEQITDLKQAVAELDQTVRDILGSTSWRITMPMRAMSHRLRSGTGRESKSGGNSSTWRLVGKLLRQPIRLGQSGMSTIKTGVRILRFVADKAVEWRTVNQRWPTPTELPRLVRSLMRLHVAQNFVEALNPRDLDALRTRLDECSDALPSISVIMPVYRTPIDLLRRAIVSVLDQIFWKWELCICDDGSANDELQKELKHWAEKDPRIRIYTLTQNSGISKATNIAIEHATGDYIAFLDHDDEFTPDALAEVALVIAENSSVDVVYSDQDKIDSRGIAFEQFHKPDWSPDYFRRVMYVGHLLVVRRSLVDAVNGFDSRFDRVQDYEFMLRVSEKSSHITHIPKVLYHWRATRGSIAASADAKGKIEELQSEAVRQHIQRIGLKGDVFPNPAFPHRVSIHYKTPAANEKVSIVIPSKDHPEHIGRCLASIYDNSKDKNVEVVVVDNGTSDPDALQILRKYPVQVVLYDEPFNYSKANNLGVAASSGSIIVLLNNDTEVISPDWLDILIGHLDQKDVGAVGPVLLYPDSTVQHAGTVLGPRGTADHVMRGFQADCDGYAGSLSCVREVTGVTGACLLTRRETYEQLGGMVEHYATHYQDVDFCLRLRKKGLRILCVPDSKLIHYESVTRGSDYDVLDRLLLQDIWAQELRSGDPYFNPAFSLAKLDYSLATNR